MIELNHFTMKLTNNLLSCFLAYSSLPIDHFEVGVIYFQGEENLEALVNRIKYEDSIEKRQLMLSTHESKQDNSNFFMGEKG